MTAEHFDVVVVGAGLSGIGAAWHLQTRAPTRSYVILEAREAIGGTWDLFRYPGIRSDSDMYTLGYSFRPWREAKAIADGPAILNYVRETAREHGIDRHIRFGHRVVRADWSSAEARWTVEVERPAAGEVVRFSCDFLYMCSGYYSYAEGHRPDFPGEGRFGGRIVHPQFWPDDLNHRGRRVVVIGSGATAVTLVPELARDAAHVVMLQRSPTYIVSRPSDDRIAEWLKRRLPPMAAYRLARWKNLLVSMFFYRLARKRPAKVRDHIMELVRQELGPDYDVATHFGPRYDPWDQRMCLVPDSDLFSAIRAGRASVVTDRIESFTEGGVRLASGGELPADIIVTATGLKLNLLGDVRLAVDGVSCDLSKSFIYKGLMFSGVPNLAFSFGYTNASWTLKADLSAEYFCRLLNHMERIGAEIATPRPAADIAEAPFVDLSSGYVQRAAHFLPRQGTKAPWKLHQNYALDLLALRYGRVDDGAMVFSRRASAPEAASPARVVDELRQ